MKNGKNKGTWFFDFQRNKISVVVEGCVRILERNYNQDQMKKIMKKLIIKGYKLRVPDLCNDAIGMTFWEKI